MNPSKLADKIRKEIEQKDLKPVSRVWFVVKNAGFWSLFALALIAGAISVALILYAGMNTDFAISEFVNTSGRIKHWFTLLPLIWLLLVGIAIGIGMVGLKHTKRGYRIALYTLVGSNLLGSLLLGGGLYAAGGGEIMEEMIDKKVSHYHGVRDKHQRFWGRPEETGRLSGPVQSVDTEAQKLILQDPLGRTWNVDYQGANYKADFEIKVGKPLKMRGTVTGSDQFKAEGLKPAHRQERMQKRIKGQLQRNPEMRALFESHLSPETRAKMKALRDADRRPDRETRNQIRNEFEANTTPDERQEIQKAMRELKPQPPLPPRFKDVR